ncbi:MAG: MarR family transcriptional regulator, partial [Actinomycetes bacterium]
TRDADTQEERRRRRRLVSAAKQALRDLRIELGVLGHRVGTRVELKDLDLDCLDVIARHGPLGPSTLARRVGVHAATMTGILSRLEDAGWIVRERVQTDRRAVVVRSVPDRQREVVRLYDGMNTALDGVLADYTDERLHTFVDFLRRATEAGRGSAADLA